jgi:CRISPR-associated protein (TIGR02710 family)
MPQENENKKIMFISLGTGKSGDDIAHGLYYSISNLSPDQIVIFASDESLKGTYPHLEKNLKSYRTVIPVEKEINNEINDVEILYEYYVSTIKKYLDKGFTKENSVVDYTSGTKSMSAALVSAAISLEVDRLSYVYGERNEGRVITGTEKSSTISPSKIFSAKLLNQFVTLYNAYQFEAAKLFLENSIIHPKYSKEKHFFIKLSEMFSSWDKFDFKNAFNNFRELDKELLTEFDSIAKFKNKYNTQLINLGKDELNSEKINDLIFNAIRRGEAGKYDDATARLYRALEMIGQINFYKEFNCFTGNVILDSLPQKAKDFLINERKYSEKGKIKIALDDTFKVLNKINNRAGNIYMENLDIFRKHLNKRNDSILAHGNTPISKESFENFLVFIEEKFIVGRKSDSIPKFAFPKIEKKY